MPIWMPNSISELYRNLHITYESGYINDSGNDLRLIITGYIPGFVIPMGYGRFESSEFGKRSRAEFEIHFASGEVSKIEELGIYIKDGFTYITMDDIKYMVSEVEDYRNYFPFGVLKVIVERGIPDVE